MNKIKLLNHASKKHPEQLERIMRLSLPREVHEEPVAFVATLKAA
jgi:hypothetical protein